MKEEEEEGEEKRRSLGGGEGCCLVAVVAVVAVETHLANQSWSEANVRGQTTPASPSRCCRQRRPAGPARRAGIGSAPRKERAGKRWQIGVWGAGRRPAVSQAGCLARVAASAVPGGCPHASTGQHPEGSCCWRGDHWPCPAIPRPVQQ